MIELNLRSVLYSFKGLFNDRTLTVSEWIQGYEQQLFRTVVSVISSFVGNPVEIL